MNLKNDNEFFNNLKSDFSYIEELPACACVIDLDKNIILKYNQLFNKVFEVEKDNVLSLADFTKYNFSRFINSLEISPDNIINTNTKMVFFKSAKGNEISSNISIKLIKKYDVNIAVVIFNQVSVKNAYFEKEMEVKEVITNIDDIIKSIFNKIPLLVYAVDAESCKVIYANEYTKEFLKSKDYNICTEKLGIIQNSKQNNSPSFEKIISGNWFEIYESDTFHINNKNIKMNIGIDISETKKFQKKDGLNSNTEILVGAYNRLIAANYIKECVNNAKKENLYYSLCYIKILNFDLKFSRELEINWGKTMKFFASTIRESIRKSDFFIRIEEDVFVIVLNNCNIITADKILKSFIDKIKNKLSNENIDTDIFKIKYNLASIDESSSSDAESILNDIEI